jgi:hypothetical protein
MDQQSNVPMMPGPPEPFYQVWIRALTKPDERTFSDLAMSPNAKAGAAYLWYFLGSTVNFLLASLVPNPMLNQLIQEYSSGSGQQIDPSAFAGSAIAAICGAPIVGAISTLFFAIGVAITQWIAKMFGGRGTTDQLAYALSAILSPFLLISGLLSLLSAIPYAGFCFGIVSLLGGLYILVLEVMAVKGVNQFGWGAALGSLFIPALVIGFVCGCLVIGSLTLLAPTIGDVFSQINQSLQSVP